MKEEEPITLRKQPSLADAKSMPRNLSMLPLSTPLDRDVFSSPSSSSSLLMVIKGSMDRTGHKISAK